MRFALNARNAPNDILSMPQRPSPLLTMTQTEIATAAADGKNSVHLTGLSRRRRWGGKIEWKSNIIHFFPVFFHMRHTIACGSSNNNNNNEKVNEKWNCVWKATTSFPSQCPHTTAVAVDWHGQPAQFRVSLEWNINQTQNAEENK